MTYQFRRWLAFLADYCHKEGGMSIQTADSLSQLLNRLFDQLKELFNSQVALLKTELREGVSSYGVKVAWVVCASMVALVGFILLSVGLSFWLNLAIDNLALSFLIVGFLYLIIGSVAAFSFAKKIAEQPSVLPHTIEEVKKDKEWIKKEI
jgi:uncharacterized membrane protein YqjE